MPPSIDFSQVEELKPIPMGWYLASVIEAKEGVSQQQNPKIDIRWKVEEGEYEGRNVFDTITFTKRAEFRVKATLKGLGYPDDFAGDVIADDLVGKTAKIMVVIDKQDKINPETGEPYPARNKVSKVAPITSGNTNLAALMG